MGRHISAVPAAVARAASHSTWHWPNGWARASGDRVVGAEHTHTRTELGSAKRDHVLADMGSNDLAVLGSGVGQDVLDEVVAVLIAGNVDQRDPGTVHAALADAVQVAAEELGTTDFQALLDDFGSKLVHAVFGSIANDMVDSPAAIRRSTVFADMLDTPVAELTMGNNVDVCQNFFNARAL